MTAGPNPVRASGTPPLQSPSLPLSREITAGFTVPAGCRGSGRGRRFGPHIVCEAVPHSNPTGPPKAAQMLLLQEAFLECTSPFPVTLSPSLVPPWSGEGRILPSSPPWGVGGEHVQPQAAHSCRPHWQLPSATGKKLAQGLDPSGGPEARDRMKQGDQAELMSFDLGTSWLRASCGASRGPRCTGTVDPPLPHSTCSLTGPYLPAPVRHTCTPPCLPESVPRELGCDAPSRHPRLVFCVPTGWSQAEPLGSYFSKP